MRIAERISRLERRDGEDAPITPEEWELATARFRQELVDHGIPFGGTIEGALSGWRNTVESGRGWIKRVYLDMQPWDFMV